MNILILANKLPFPPRDGGSIATLQMLLGLQEAGNKVSCLAMNTRKHSFPVEDIPQGIQKKISFLGVDVDTRIRPIRLALNFLFSNKPYIAERFNMRDFRLALKKVLQEEGFDIIQFEGPYLSCYLDDIRSNSTAPVILRAHNLEHLIWHRISQGERSPLKRWYFKKLSTRLQRFELNLARQVEGLVNISQKDEDYFREMGIDTPMLTIATGLNMKDYPLKKSTSPATLFFIGSLDWLPNQEGLLWFLHRVFKQVLDSEPEVEFHVAGRNAPSHILQKLNHPNITFHGEVENAREFMQSYGIMVAPLFSGSGIRIKILEAMALGRPVVTTSTGIEGIPAENLPSVLKSDDAQGFARMLLKLMNNGGESEHLVEEARNLIRQEFDILELSKRLHQFYLALA